MQQTIKAAPNHLFVVGKFVTFQIDDNDYDGLIEKTSDVGVLLAYFDQGKERRISKFFCDIRLTDQTGNDWWEEFLNRGGDSVLGDREPDPLKIDAIGL